MREILQAVLSGRALVYKDVGEMEKDEKKSHSGGHVKLLKVIC